MTTMCFAACKRQLTYSPTPMASQKYDEGQLGKNEVPIFFGISIEEMHVCFERSRVSA